MGYAGHHPVHAGLQKESVGDIYPLAIVGYGHCDKTLYVIENLVTGKVLGAQGYGQPRQWSSPSAAREYLDKWRNRFDCEVWHDQRPVFSKIAGDLLLAWPWAAKPTTRPVLPLPPVRRERPVSLMGRCGASSHTPLEEYYAALEQDIG